MKDYRLWILNELLDRLERSKHQRDPAASPRAVALQYDRRQFPDYWRDESADHRLAIHAATRELAASELIHIQWDRQARHQVARAALNLERLADAYRLAGRTPRRVQEDELARLAGHWAGQLSGWAAAFAAALAGRARAGERLPAGFQPDEVELLDSVCRCLAAAASLAAPAPKRVFSLQVLGDSKAFEGAVQRRLLAAARQFWPEAPGEDHELLAELGIVQNPDHLFLYGPLTLAWQGRQLDLEPLVPDVGLPAALVQRAAVAAVRAERVITIENLTSFHQYVLACPPATVAIYLGGYHNRVRRQFLHKLFLAAPGAAFLHWGDIDLGGLQIYHLLRTQSGVPIEPWRMDAGTLRSHLHKAAPFDAAYGRKLAALLTEPGYERFRPVVELMLAEGKRLEQESVSPWDTG